jgi:hypothetical protein
MNKKDYKIIAQAIAAAHIYTISTYTVKKVVEQLCSVLKIDNPRFSEDVFRLYIDVALDKNSKSLDQPDDLYRNSEGLTWVE